MKTTIASSAFNIMYQLAAWVITMNTLFQMQNKHSFIKV
jgi:hypothetical protein